MTRKNPVTDISALLALVQFDAEDGKSGERRDALCAQVAPALLARYEQRLASGRHPALVAIANGVCSGCRVRLPTSVAQAARRQPADLECPACGRLLHAPAPLQAPPPQTAPAPRRRSRGAAEPSAS